MAIKATSVVRPQRPYLAVRPFNHILKSPRDISPAISLFSFFVYSGAELQSSNAIQRSNCDQNLVSMWRKNKHRDNFAMNSTRALKYDPSKSAAIGLIRNPQKHPPSLVL